METRAHYTLIGAFVVAIIAATFGFIYWLQWGGGIGEQTQYRVRFEQPPSGLGSLSTVTFNGVRVGNVTALRLDPQNPKVLIAAISVDPATPIRADTQVELSYQGLTGAPVLALKGGDAGAPKLTSPNGMPVLVVKPGSSRDLTESARETLGNIDKVIADNAKSVNVAINGIATFADMLGRNSGRVEGLLGGLEKLAGTGENAKKANATFDLVAPSEFAQVKDIAAQMTVPDINATLVYDTQRLLTRTADGKYATIDGAEWADNLPKLIQTKIVQSFENAKQLKSVSKPIDQLEPEYRLELSIRGFQIVPDQTPSAVVELAARLVTDKGEVKGAQIFKAAEPLQDAKADQAAGALNKAFGKVAQELVTWAAGSL